MSKYKKGALITSIDELVEQDFIYHRGNIYNRDWFMSWQIRYTMYEIEHGQVFKAEKEHTNYDDVVKSAVTEARADAIDEFVEKYKECWNIWMECPHNTSSYSCIKCVAEKLKQPVPKRNK